MEKPTYTITIPSIVRFDTRLCLAARLLYGEILVLCDQQGYCWASNQYFAQLYEVQRKAVSRWIQQLAEYDYIRLEIDPTEGNLRRIYPTTYPFKKGNLSSHQGKGYPPKEDTCPSRKTRDSTPLLNTFIIDNNDRVDRVLPKKGIVKKEDTPWERSATESHHSVPGPSSHQVKKATADTGFMKPTIAEVATYMQSQSELCPNAAMAQDQAPRFVNYYQSNGWKVGRHPMQDWQAAARNWLLNTKTYEKTQRSYAPTSFAQSSEESNERSMDYSIPL